MFVCVLCAIWVFILAVNGLLPGMAGYIPSVFSDLGAIQCGEHSLSALIHLRCMAIGGDVGAIITLGSPLTLLCSLILVVFPVSVNAVYFMVTAGLMLIALLGAYNLIHALRVSRYIALTCSALYLLLPITLSMQSFGGTYWGCVLLPSYIFLVWKMLQGLSYRSWRGVIPISILWIVLSGFSLFMDGYSFFMFATSSIVLIGVWSWGRWREVQVWIACGLFLGANGISFVLYRHLLPGSGSWADSIDLFRAMGADFVTFFRPAGSLWWVKALGIHFNSSPLWGDGSNSSSNYIGFLMLGLSAFGVYIFRKKVTQLGVALLVIGVIAFILSLGPSLKVNSIKPTSVDGPVAHSSYLMPSSDALMTLPTTVFYKVVPGLKSMRATYRWHVLTMLVMVSFAAFAIQNLVDRKKLKIAYILLALLCLELIPNPVDSIKAHLHVASEIAQFNNAVLKPLATYVKPGQRIIYYPNAVGNNDFLADYLTPSVNAWTYNIGGDKAQAIAYMHMPQPIYSLLTTDDNPATLPQSGAQMRAVLQKKLVDEIIVPTFDLRWDSYSWPPVSRDTYSRAQLIIQSAKHDGLLVSGGGYFYVVRLKPSE